MRLIRIQIYRLPIRCTAQISTKRRQWLHHHRQINSITIIRQWHRLSRWIWIISVQTPVAIKAVGRILNPFTTHQIQRLTKIAIEVTTITIYQTQVKQFVQFNNSIQRTICKPLSQMIPTVGRHWIWAIFCNKKARKMLNDSPSIICFNWPTTVERWSMNIDCPPVSDSHEKCLFLAFWSLGQFLSRQQRRTWLHRKD